MNILLLRHGRNDHDPTGEQKLVVAGCDYAQIEPFRFGRAIYTADEEASIRTKAWNVT